VDGHRVSERHFVRFAEVAPHHAVVEADPDPLLDHIGPLDNPHVPVEHGLVGRGIGLVECG